MSYRRSSIKGAGAFRRLIRQLPDSANGRMIALLNTAGPSLAAGMKGRIHSRTGALANAIGSRVTPKSLNLKVGVLSTRLGKSQFFYGNILDKGRKAKTVTIKRGPRTGRSMRISPLAPLRLVYQGLQDFKHQFLPDYRRLMNDILLEAAKGGSIDD